MLSQRDLLILGILVLVAAVAGLATYVILDLLAPETTAGVTPLPGAATAPTATASPLPSPSPLPATATPTPQPTPVAQFGRILFGTGVQGQQLVNQGISFPPGTKQIYARWSYRNMRDGTPYYLSWLLDNSPWAYESLTWDTSRYGQEGDAYLVQIAEQDADGLPPGSYQLELFIEDRLVQIASFSVLAPTPTPPPPTPTPQPNMRQIGRRASRALVEIAMEGDVGYSWGSGSIVDSEQGLILTNWHIVTDDWGDLMNESGYVLVWLTEDPDREPVLTYWARVLPDYSDPEDDLALLQITHRVEDDSRVELPLDLPAIPLGDSGRVRRGDRVLLLGFPDYAEGTVSWTEDVVATVTEEWIKSGAEASYGHSGGMMLDERGELVGVITGGEVVGMEGQLTLARPINAAAGLLRQAAAGVPPLPPEEPVAPEPAQEYMVVLVAPSLNLRQRPSLDSPKLAEVERGAAVEVMGASEWDGERFWYPVQAVESGQSGWASEVYLASWDVAQTPLLFTSDRGGSLDIYRIYPDGSDLARLTEAPGDEGDASWSPGRSHIVFTYAQDGDSDLYHMEADGSNWQQLTAGPASDVHPVWAPDGTRIAFVSDRDGDWEIYILDLETREIRQVTFNEAWDSFPSWSPTATRLVYTSQRTGNYDLFMLNLETGQETQLTTNPYSDAHPAWSPLGDEIAYTMVVAEGGTLRREIAVMSVYYPENPWRLTGGKAGDALHRYPDWSPDGRWIVFESERDGNREIYLMPAGGGLMHNLTQAAGSEESGPAWGR